MPFGLMKIDVKKCAKVPPPHPCDPKKPCDPLFQMDDCPKPYLCTEKIKNPAWPGENTKCKPGPFMYAKSCAKVFPPHPCDPKPPCSLKTPHERAKKLECIEPPLCYERIKNPEDRRKEDPSCDESK